MVKAIDITGQTFGLLTAIQSTKKRTSNGHVLWLCQCRCGEKAYIVGTSLRNGSVQSCGCRHHCQYLNGYDANKQRLYNKYRNRARAKKIKFDLMIEQFHKLTQQDCYYCNHKPSSIMISKEINRLEPYIYNGIDRVDSSKGYTAKNCVPCCRPCNVMKMDLSKRAFFAKIRKIYDKWLK